MSWLKSQQKCYAVYNRFTAKIRLRKFSCTQCIDILIELKTFIPCVWHPWNKKFKIEYQGLQWQMKHAERLNHSLWPNDKAPTFHKCWNYEEVKQMFIFYLLKFMAVSQVANPCYISLCFSMCSVNFSWTVESRTIHRVYITPEQGYILNFLEKKD